MSGCWGWAGTEAKLMCDRRQHPHRLWVSIKVGDGQWPPGPIPLGGGQRRPRGRRAAANTYLPTYA